ncbi:hypothetical protein SAMN05216383_10212 [Prevotella sp. KH2C16]|nr:hypothetical protein SAMN05216383_10212 [Prevotella sp. KH2C16]
MSAKILEIAIGNTMEAPPSTRKQLSKKQKTAKR